MPDSVPQEWQEEAATILRGIKEAGWNDTDVAERTGVNSTRNPRHIFQGILLTCQIVRAEGRICTYCVATAEPAGRQPEDGYRIHVWRMGKPISDTPAKTGTDAGRIMAAMLETHQHQERYDTGPNGGLVLPPHQSAHRWEGGPAWRDQIH